MSGHGRNGQWGGSTLGLLAGRAERMMGVMGVLRCAALLGLLLVAFVASGCGTSSNSNPGGGGGEPFNGIDEGALKKKVAEQFGTTSDKIACQSDGLWNSPTGDSRNIAYCRVIGGYAFERGCYDSNYYDDLTVPIRSTEGFTRKCAQ